MRKFISKPLRSILIVFIIVSFTFVVSYRNSLYSSIEISFHNWYYSNDVEEYRVYSALIQQLYVKESDSLIVIQRQRISSLNNYYVQLYTDSALKITTSPFPVLSEDTIRDFVLKNQRKSNLNSFFELPVKHLITEESDLTDLKYDNWDVLLSEKYSNAHGMIRLSKVGFNKDTNLAFVYVEFLCSALCGGSDNVLLEKKNGTWKIREIHSGWRS